MPVEFYLNILLLFTLLSGVFFFKSIYLKFCVFVFFYPIVTLFCVKFNIPLFGIITAIGSKFFTQNIADYAYAWSITGYLVFISTLWSVRNQRIEFDTLKINAETRLILLICHAVFAIVAYPRAFYIADYRFNLLPGGGWASIYSLFSILIILSSKKKFSLIEIIHLAITFFVILGGERADSMLILLFMLIYRGDEVKKEIRLNIKFFSIATLSVSFFLIVGAMRHKALDFLLNNYGDILPLVGTLLLTSLYNQQTVSDTAHVYLSSVWGYFNDQGSYMTLLNTPFTLFPMTPLGGATSPYYYQQWIHPYIPNAGGGLFYSEGALNFGLSGVIFYAFLLGFIIKKTLISKKLFGHLAFVALFVLQMRIQWYGFLYMMKPFVLLYLFSVVYDLSRQGYFKKNELH